jgi:hypothetical protein
MRRALVLLLALAPLGCAHYFVNERLERAAPQDGYRFGSAPVGSGSTLVCLAFSGGGTRAAALSYSVLEKLRDTPIHKGQGRLLDTVDCISAVSGGSFAATCYALGPDTFFEDFRARFLERNVQREIEVKVALNSWWLWMAHYFKRSDLAQELYDDTIFQGKTYKDLIGRRPFVVVNATDLTNGQRFEFTQEEFDLLGSDLTTFPIARAVTASSAFPFAFSTITLRNHSRLDGPSPGFELPAGCREALAAREKDPRLYEWGRHQARYAAPDGPSYLHLSDGGLSDNSGARAIWAALRRSDGFLRRRIDSGQVRRLVVIVANALNDPLIGLGDTESSPNVVTVTEKAARISVNALTFESVSLLRDDPALRALFAARQIDASIIQVGFDGIEDPERRARLRAIPTELKIEKAQLADVIAAGREVLGASPEFQRLVRELE